MLRSALDSCAVLHLKLAHAAQLKCAARLEHFCNGSLTLEGFHGCGGLLLHRNKIVVDHFADSCLIPFFIRQCCLCLLLGLLLIRNIPSLHICLCICHLPGLLLRCCGCVCALLCGLHICGLLHLKSQLLLGHMLISLGVHGCLFSGLLGCLRHLLCLFCRDNFLGLNISFGLGHIPGFLSHCLCFLGCLLCFLRLCSLLRFALCRLLRCLFG